MVWTPRNTGFKRRRDGTIIVDGRGTNSPLTLFTVATGGELVEERAGSLLSDSDVCLKCGVTFNAVRSWLKIGLRADADPDFASFAHAWAQAKVHVREQLLEAVRESIKPFTPAEPSQKPGDVKSAQWLIERFDEPGPPRRLDHEDLLAEVQSEDQSVDTLFSDPPEELIEGIRRNRAHILAILESIDAESRPKLT